MCAYDIHGSKSNRICCKLAFHTTINKYIVDNPFFYGLIIHEQQQKTVFIFFQVPEKKLQWKEEWYVNEFHMPIYVMKVAT